MLNFCLFMEKNGTLNPVYDSGETRRIFTDKGLAEAISSQSPEKYLLALEEGGFDDLEPYLSERAEAERIVSSRGIPRLKRLSTKSTRRPSNFNYGLLRQETNKAGVDYQANNIFFDTQAKIQLLKKCGEDTSIKKGETESGYKARMGKTFRQRVNSL